ncbi:TIGR02594 family protein [Acidovorax sp. LjRoot194]|uniref:NlpC/P60 family protein n=1 Tax=Acidovorax sp. LjRoot194 TaxID=3342280 RepID=UPI003ED07020
MITDTVGQGGRNSLNDTMIVQRLLNEIDMPGAQQLVADGSPGARTIFKIQAFQRSIGMSRPDGLIRPGSKTMTELMCRADAENTLHTKVALTNPAPTSADLGAPWIATAESEIGQKEVVGSKANPRIMEYHKASKHWAKDDSGKLDAWCGSFVAWVMAKHGYAPPRDAYRALEWAKFGTALKAPVYGAICVKSRTGGGHVAFAVGQSRDGKDYYVLGGNQDNEVNIKKYPATVWDAFVFPLGAGTGTSLPVYQGTAGNAGRES